VNMLSNITSHYASQVGIKNNVGVGQTKIAGAVAFFNPKDQSIRINAFGNRISTALDNTHSFKSTLEHEEGHADNYPKGTDDIKGTSHADVYMNQMKKQDFILSPLPYREGVTGGMIKELFRDTDIFAEQAQHYVDQNKATLSNAGLHVQIQQVGPCQTCAEYQVNNHTAVQVPLPANNNGNE